MTIDYATSVTTLDGEVTTLEAYRGKVLLVVNTASQCGFTPQYAGLEALWRDKGDQGLVVLGFPCNQFGAQEPGDADAIRNFCADRFKVSFPMFGKVDVNGPNTHPLWIQLKQGAPGLLRTEGIKWNFTKFVVDRNGLVVARYAPQTKPDQLAADLDPLLRMNGVVH